MSMRTRHIASLQIIISAKGIYRAALLTSIRNFADFRSSINCVLVNAFLDVFRNVITRNLRRCLRVSTSVIYYSKLPSVSLLTPCILRILTFLIRRPLPPRMRLKAHPTVPSASPQPGFCGRPAGAKLTIVSEFRK